MKKQFLILSMVLVGLFAGVNNALALEGRYYAKLVGRTSASATGSGKVYVSATTSSAVEKWDSKRNLGSYPNDETWAEWVENESNVEYVGALAAADGIDMLMSQFAVYAKADEGSYFAGWSYTDGYTDLGTESSLSLKLAPSKTRATMDPDDEMGGENDMEQLTKGTLVNYNAREYVVYATFEPLLISDYTIDGDNTTTERTCTQTVTFQIKGTEVDTRDFYLPTIVKKAGTAGTWTIGPTAEMWTENPSDYSADYGNNGEIYVPVTFTADDDNVGEFSATLQLTSKVGKTMKVILSARTTDSSGEEAIRYDEDGEKVDAGDLTAMIAAAAATDVIKLNADYASPVTIDKSLTFDLNGYTLSNTLTISGGDVVLAYSPYGGVIENNVTVEAGGVLTLNGSEITGNVTVYGTLNQNGATISGKVINNGTMTTTDGSCLGNLSSSGVLNINGGYFKNDADFDQPAITITDGTATISRGDIGGTDDDQCYYGVKAEGGKTTIGKLATLRGEESALWNAGGTIIVNGGKFFNPEVLATGDITFHSGYFKYTEENITEVRGKQVWRNAMGPEFREGYLYFAGDQDAAQASNVSVCHIGPAAYASLDEALSYANNHPSEEVTIIMDNDYTLRAGYYTIPANATLIVPMSDTQETANPIVPRESSEIPEAKSFRKLTFESGVNMTVLGTIELSCTQYGKQPEMGVPGGNYGHLILKPGSHITLSNGSVLRAWGFVTGDGTKDAEGNYLSGEIDARRGSTVREMFQMGDWKGGDISFSMAMDIPGMDPTWRDLTHLFPVYIYFIQNVESLVKYHPGSSLICAASVNVRSDINAYANDIKVVGKDGEAAMFLMDEMADAENTWVRKFYDAKKDQQVYEVNSGAKLGSVVIELGQVPGSALGASGKLDLVLDSRKFVLPLTSNFKIHLLSGYMQFTQSTSCLPGMEVEVDKESEIAITKDKNIVSGALYLYDADQWSFTSPYNGKTGGYVNSGKFGAIVRYSATWDLDPEKTTSKPNVRDISSPAAIGDAKLIVHGTFRSGKDCAVYTSWSKDMSTMGLAESGTGGASIISTNEDAGTFIFDAAAPAFDGITFDVPGDLKTIHMGTSVLVNYDHNDYGMGTQYPIQMQTVLGKDERVYGFELFTPAKLKNNDGSLTATEGTFAGTSFCYMNDQWSTMQVAEDPCFMKEIVGGQTTYYAKPAEYVAVNATWDDENGVMVGNADYTFSDKDGAGRLFILMEDCQWWEVEKKDNLYHCIHPDNDTYYYWDETEGKWMEKRFTITWLNWNGDTIRSYTINPTSNDTIWQEYNVPYGTQAEYLGINPTREPTRDYTYDFKGWAPALGKVTSDVTYTATYSEQPRKYKIIFTNEGGDEIERHLLTLHELPVCENIPTRTGFTLQWEPTLAAVTGDQTYRATWLPEPPKEYEIRFVDYDGETVLKPTDETPYMVAVGEMPEAPEILEGKPAGSEGKPQTSEFSYIFDHWSPAVTKVTQAMTYTAVYREIPRTYTIIFLDENSNQIEEKQYTYGETPVCTTPPTKENTAQYTYTFAWDPQIQTVMSDATYKAVFTSTTNRYAVTLKSNPSGACAFTGAGIYEYGKNVNDIAIASYNSDEYEFQGWSDLADKNATEHPAFILTRDTMFIANFRYTGDDKVTITWQNWDGETLATSEPKKGTATTYAGPTPERESTSTEIFTFDGWTDAEDTYYKNGMTPKATVNATYKAHYAVKEIANLEVGSDATVVLSAPVEYQDLVLTSNGVTSGQLFGADDYLTLTGEAYFDFVVNAKARLWYQVAVPWRVNAQTGIYADGRHLILGKDFDVIYYDGATRASEHVNKAWSYVELGDKMMYPGQLYMIAILSDVSVLRFEKDNDASYLTTKTSVSRHDSDVANDRGWNGVSNPALFHAYVNTGVTKGQVYNPEYDNYSPISMSSTKMVVGQGAYVQVENSKNIYVSSGGSYAAPRRRAKAETSANANYEVHIAPVNKAHTDVVFVETNDQKTPDVYTIGLDLTKMGVSTKVAQMWVERYNAKLCFNTMAPVEGQVDYPLGIFAPEAGEYSIAIFRTAQEQPADLYLTLDGEVIWNLSKNAYTAELEAGTTNRYGLRMVAKAPQITTDIEETTVDNDSKEIKATKVLINDHVYILRDGKVYTITGQIVNKL